MAPLVPQEVPWDIACICTLPLYVYKHNIYYTGEVWGPWIKDEMAVITKSEDQKVDPLIDRRGTKKLSLTS